MASVIINLPTEWADQTQADAFLSDLASLTGKGGAAALFAGGDMAREHLIARIKLRKRTESDRAVDARLKTKVSR